MTRISLYRVGPRPCIIAGPANQSPRDQVVQHYLATMKTLRIIIEFTKSSDALIDYFACFCSYRLSYRLLLLWCHSVSIQGERLAPSLPWIQSSVTPFAEMLHDKTPMY